MWVFVEDTLLSWLFSEVCVLQGSVWDAAALWTWGQCRDMVPLPRNLFLTVLRNAFTPYCICDTAPFLGNPGAKYIEITEISLPHRPKNHKSRPHDIQETAQRIEFNNNNKKYNCTNPFLVGGSLPGQALWITVTTCISWQTVQTLLPGSFSCLPPGDPLSLIFLLWVFAMLLDSVQALGCKL